METITWEIPIKTVSESNCSEHWAVKSKRHRMQQFFVRAMFNRANGGIRLPCEITLTRVALRALDDDDNLPMAFKWIKDEIGACLFPEKVVIVKKKNGKYIKNKGHADADPRVKWRYAQEKGRKYAIRVEFRALDHQKDEDLTHTEHNNIDRG